jgi:membrane fusion protein
MVILCLALLVLIYLAVGRVARKHTVPGIIEPVSGVARVYAPHSGIVLEKRVEEGQAVQQGQILYVLSAARSAVSAVVVEDAVREQLLLQRTRLQTQMQNEAAANSAESRQALAQQRSTQRELTTLDEQIAAQVQQERISAQNLLSQRKLSGMGYLARLALEDIESRHLALQQQGKSLHRERERIRRALAASADASQSVGLRSQNRESDYANQLASVEQQLVELAARTSTAVRAPVAGRVGGLVLQVGQSSNAQAALATVIPQDAVLQARLYVPSRAIGFMQPGQSVKLRIHAFPYARFGLHDGQINSVSEALLLPNEQTNLPNQEAAYPVLVRLPSQTRWAYGKSWQLQSGMTVDADVVMDRQRIAAWLIEPLLALRRG